MPTSNGLSYWMNSLPRRACPTGAPSTSASAIASSWASRHPAPAMIITLSAALRRRASSSTSAGAGITHGAVTGAPAPVSCTASCPTTSPGSTRTDTPPRPPAVRIAIRASRGICSATLSISQ